MQIYWKSAGILPVVVLPIVGVLGLMFLVVSILYFRSKYLERRSKSFRKSMRKASRASMRMASTNNIGSVYGGQRALSQMDMSQMGMSQRAMSQMGMSNMGIAAVPSFAMPGAPMMDYNGMMEPQMSQYAPAMNSMYNEMPDDRADVTIINANNSSMAHVHNFNSKMAQ